MPFSILNPWLIVIALVSLLTAFGGGYAKGLKDESVKHTAQELLIAKASEAAQQAAASEIAKIEVRHTTIRQKVQREVIEKPVYRDCRHDADGVRLVNQALANSDTAGGVKLPSQPR